MKFTYKRAPLYLKQSEAIFHGYRVGLVEASTKSGKTLACITWIFEKALFAKEGTFHWWVAPSSSQARIAWHRLNQYTKKYQQKEVGLVQVVKNPEYQIVIKGHGTIVFKTADDPQYLYGEDVHSIVVDEASRIKGEAIIALRSTVTATGGELRLIGNVTNRKNLFYQLCRDAEAGTLKNAHYAMLTALDAIEGGIFTLEELEEARSFMKNEDAFQALFFCKPPEAGTNPLGDHNITACTIHELSSEEPVVWGVDLGKYHDWTVIIGLDKNGHMCRYYRYQKTKWQYTVDLLCSIVRPGTPLCIDQSSVGDPIHEQLETFFDDSVTGVRISTLAVRNGLIEGLRLSLESRMLRILDGDVTKECYNLEYGYTDGEKSKLVYRVPKGEHDDCIIALALANQVYRDKYYSAVKARPKQVLAVIGGTGREEDELIEFAIAPQAPRSKAAMVEINGLLESYLQEGQNWREIFNQYK